ncbi:hypothetical protein BV20DRAFT_973790 [Pilatotrama ljubarskyi]|nr:hypothetical protein BV20DRAFT_973790 [Pilatotrama ljubarskyi]
MLYGLLRAFLASFLPLLPILFHARQLDDWNRSLPSPFALHYLAPSRSHSITNHTYDLAQDFDYAISVQALRRASASLDTTHPLFEALAAIAHRLFPGPILTISWGLPLEALVVLILLTVWASLRPSSGRAVSDKRPSPPSAEVPLDDGKLASEETSVTISADLSHRLSKSNAFLPLFFFSNYATGSVESPNTETICQLLRSWYEDPDSPDPTSTPNGSPRPRSLSDIAEQSEPGDSDTESSTSSSYCSCSDSLQRMTHSTIRQWLPDSLRQPDGVVTDAAKLLLGNPSDDWIVADPSETPAAEALESCPPPTLGSRPDSSIALSGPPLSCAAPRSEAAPGTTPKAPGPRSRRTSSILVCRTGMPGQQMVLTSEGIDYVTSQLQVNAGSDATSKEQRRRLARIVSDATTMFSEKRGRARSWSATRPEYAHMCPNWTPAKAPRDIIDGQRNPPLAGGLQSRRQLLEVGRSRSGTGCSPTPLVFLERSKRAATDSARTAMAKPAPPELVSTGSAASAGPGALDSEGVFTGRARRLTYAAVAAKPTMSARQRYLSEQLSRATANSIGRSTLTTGSLTPRSTPRRAAPVDLRAYGAFASHVTSASQTKSWRSRHTSESVNWRGARILPGSSQLDAEFVSSPAAFIPGPPKHGLRPTGSLLSLTAHVELRDLARLASERKDIVFPPLQASGSTRRPEVEEDNDGDHQDDEILLFRERRSSKEVACQYRRRPHASPSDRGVYRSRSGWRVVVEDEDFPILDGSAVRRTDADACATLSPSLLGSTSASPAGFLGYSGSSSECSLTCLSGLVSPHTVSSGRMLGSAAALRVVESDSDGPGHLGVARARQPSAACSAGMVGEQRSGDSSELQSSLSLSVSRNSGPPTAPMDSCHVLRQQALYSRTVAPLTASSALLRMIGQRTDPALLLPRHSGHPEQPRYRRSTAPAGRSTYMRHAVNQETEGSLVDRSLATRQAALKTTSEPHRSEVLSSPAAFDDYSAVALRRLGRLDAGAFEQVSRGVDVGVPNRGHQPAPHALSRHKCAALSAARMRTRTTPGSTGEGSERRRIGSQFTGGRFDVLEPDLILR